MLLYCTLLVCHTFFFPHGDLDRRINEYSQLIVLYPDSLYLYVDRGDLYLQHEEFDLARKDFSYCMSKGLNTAFILEGLSRSMAVPPMLDSSLFYINLSLDEDSSSFSAVEWKAHLLFLLHNYCESAAGYERLIQDLPYPSPTLYLDASTSWINCSGPGNIGNAIAIIKSGMDRIGSLHVLQKELIRLYLEQKDYKSALIEQSLWIERATYKASPLLDRARIYLLAGENDMAQTDLENALIELSALPSYKQSVPGMLVLKERIENLLTQLKG